MIITRAPLRMSFVGGGSDLPAFYRKHGGAVVSTSIDKYVYVTINKKFDQSLRVSYSKTEEVERRVDLEHPLVREALGMLGIEGGLEITSVADIPAKGTGLGSSSTFSVALLHALHTFEERAVSGATLAEQTCRLEIDILGEPIGRQDQYAAAFGGFNFIRFDPDDSVIVEPIICKSETKRRLSQDIVCFYTGITRSASKILKQQSSDVDADKKKQDVLCKMVGLAETLKAQLEANNLTSFGELLHENWVLKTQLASGITSPQIEDWYTKARAAGALGGKLLGAGSGGFLMFFAPQERHEAIAHALSDLRQVPFGFEPRGSSVIFVH